MPRLDDLPTILERSNRLARIDRYLSSTEEFLTFFLSVRQLQLSSVISSTEAIPPTFRSRENLLSAEFESTRAREKILQEQKLCQTYIKQYDTLVQLVSWSSSLWSVQ